MKRERETHQLEEQSKQKKYNEAWKKKSNKVITILRHKYIQAQIHLNEQQLIIKQIIDLIQQKIIEIFWNQDNTNTSPASMIP